MVNSTDNQTLNIMIKSHRRTNIASVPRNQSVNGEKHRAVWTLETTDKTVLYINNVLRK